MAGRAFCPGLTRKTDNRGGDCLWPWLKARRKFRRRQQEKFRQKFLCHSAVFKTGFASAASEIVRKASGRPLKPTSLLHWHGLIVARAAMVLIIIFRSIEGNVRVSLQSNPPMLGSKLDEPGQPKPQIISLDKRDVVEPVSGNFCQGPVAITGHHGVELCARFHLQRRQSGWGKAWCARRFAGTGQGCGSNQCHLTLASDSDQSSYSLPCPGHRRSNPDSAPNAIISLGFQADSARSRDAVVCARAAGENQSGCSCCCHADGANQSCAHSLV